MLVSIGRRVGVNVTHSTLGRRQLSSLRRRKRNAEEKVDIARDGLLGCDAVWAQGNGVNGALGNGSMAVVPLPGKIANGDMRVDAGIKQVVAGWAHSALVTDDGGLFLFGRTHDVENAVRLGRIASKFPALNKLYSLVGVSRSIDAVSPAQVLHFLDRDNNPVFEKVKFAACGAGVSAAIGESGTLYCIGSNQFGQCGIGTKDPYVWEPTAVKGLEKGDEKIAQVSLGFRHGVAVSENGNLYSWGKGHRGQIGLKKAIHDVSENYKANWLPFEAKVVQAHAGMHHSVALTEKGEIYVWGKFQGEHVDKSTNTFTDSHTPRIVKFRDEENHPIKKIWVGWQHNVAQSAKDPSLFFQWGLISDRAAFRNEAVERETDWSRSQTHSRFQQLDRIGAARTVIYPVPFRMPLDITEDTDFNIIPGMTRSFIVGKDIRRPFVWDWSLSPVPIDFDTPDLKPFVNDYHIVNISEGWQHILYHVDKYNEQ